MCVLCCDQSSVGGIVTAEYAACHSMICRSLVCRKIVLRLQYHPSFSRCYVFKVLSNPATTGLPRPLLILTVLPMYMQ